MSSRLLNIKNEKASILTYLDDIEVESLLI